MVKKFTRRAALLVSGIGLSLGAGAQQYCIPTESLNSCNFKTVIAGFSTTGGTTNISNNGNNCSNGFQSWATHTSTQGSIVGFSITAGDYGGTNKIWVDWNQDFDFDDAGEEVFTGSAVAFSTTNGNFAILNGTTLGTTRMRVRYSYDPGSTACDYQAYSEYEDYNFTVTAGAPCTPPTLSTVVTNVSCFDGSNGTINLTPTGGVAPYTFLWENGVTTEDRTGLVAGTNYSVTTTDAIGCIATASGINITQPAKITAIDVLTHVSCFGGNNGAIDLSPIGGTPPYSYLWNNGATTEDRTGLTAALYNATVTDVNGCTGIFARSIHQPAIAVSGSAVANVSCSGSNGSINLTTTGGTAPYYYVWNDGATTEDRTNLSAGTYSVTITDYNGCTAIASATVGQPITAFSVNTVITNVSCFNGSNGAINLTPIGGVAPYTFLWNNGATTEDRTGLIAGTYSVTATDANGCAIVSNSNVSQPAGLSSGNVLTHVTCFGGNNGTINFTPSGGTPPYTFLWNNGDTTEDRIGLTAALYTATITDVNGCTILFARSIRQPATAVSTTAVVTNATCNTSDGNIDMTPAGGTPGYTYQWTGSNITTEDRTGLAAGNYVVTVTDAVGCTATRQLAVTGPTLLNPAVTVSAPASAICYLSPATFTASGTDLNGGTYAWSRNGVVIPNETGSTLTVADISKYKLDTVAVSVTGITGCVSTNNASAQVAVQAAAPPNPAITATGSRNLCEGQSVTLTNVPNASNAFGFSWKDGNNTEVNTTYEFTTAVAGTYTLTITDPTNGCTRTAPQQVVNVKPLPVVNASADGVLTLCPTGSVILSNSVVETGATYRWKKDGVTNVSTTSSYTAKTTGSYALTATLNGCTVVSPSFGVLVKAVPNAVVTANGATALCPGTNVVLSTANVAGYTYQWYNGSTALSGQNSSEYTATAAGSYKVAISNDGCTPKNSSAKSVSITNLAPTITQTASSASSVTLRGNNGTIYGYQWYLNNSPIANATSQTYVATVNGSYTLELSRNGCMAMSSTKTVNSITSLSKLTIAEEAQQAISVYPNPSEGIFNIASEDAVNVIVRDVQGRVIVNLTNAAQVDLTNQAAGIYLMQIMDAKGNLLQSERLIKK